jgi:hypothetical protein
LNLKVWSWLMKFWQVCAGGATLLVLTAAIAFFTRHHDLTFDRLHEARSKLATMGLHVTSDCANGQFSCGFMISRSSATWSDVCCLRKSGTMGPEWRGRVWVTLSPNDWRIESIPDRAGVRVWGSVIAFGDDELLREIEASL